MHHQNSTKAKTKETKENKQKLGGFLFCLFMTFSKKHLSYEKANEKVLLWKA